MLNRKLRVGIIGCGIIAPFHIEALLRLPDVQIRGLADAVESKVISLTNQYDIDFYTTDYHQILKEDVDIIDICSPSGLHCQMALDAITADKHVMVEKPLAVNLRQADEMIELSKKAGVKLAVIFDHRFDHLSIKVKQALSEGKFGKLILCDAYVKWYRTEEYYRGTWRGNWDMDGGGVLANQAIHWVDLLQWVIGPVKRVFGKIKTVTHDIEGADLAVAVLEFRNGTLGVIEASTSIYPGTKGRGIVYLNLPEQFGIYGEKGSVEIEESKRVKLWEFEDGVQTSETIDPEIKGKVPVTSHYEELKQIVNAIREDGNVPVDGEEARKSLEVIRAIYYSSFTGKQVELPFSHDQDAELDQLIERSIRHES